MTCRLCGRRAARRACPALNENICSVCCGTKRVTEIRCPSECQYLISSRAHPAAVVRRQQEADLKVFLPSVQELSDKQSELMWQLLGFLRDYRGDALIRTTDADIEAAAIAVASTHETAARGLIYQQRPNSLPAQRLATDLEAFIAKLPGEHVSSLDRDLAAALRAIERGARDARKNTGGDTEYQALLRRLLVPSEKQTVEKPASGLIA